MKPCEGHLEPVRAPQEWQMFLSSVCKQASLLGNGSNDKISYPAGMWGYLWEPPLLPGDGASPWEPFFPGECCNSLCARSPLLWVWSTSSPSHLWSCVQWIPLVTTHVCACVFPSWRLPFFFVHLDSHSGFIQSFVYELKLKPVQSKQRPRTKGSPA